MPSLQAVPLKLMNDAAQFTAPVFLDLLLKTVEDDEPSWKGYTIVVSMFVALILGTLADNQHFQRVMRAGFQMRSIVTTEVHRKLLYIQPTNRAAFSHRTDLQLRRLRFRSASTGLPEFVESDVRSAAYDWRLRHALSPTRCLIPCRCGVAARLGPSTDSHCAVVCWLCPSSAARNGRKGKARRRTRLRQYIPSPSHLPHVHRLLVLGVDAVKCNAREKPFWNRILAVRGRELGILWKSFVLSAPPLTLDSSVEVEGVCRCGEYFHRDQCPIGGLRFHLCRL